MTSLPTRTIALASVLVLPGLSAQRPDSMAALPDLSVSAPRDPSAQGQAGWSLTLLGGEAARRGQLAPSLDELLGFVPGLLARDRPDRSLDTRIIVRGAGARANFGVRGVRVLVDGVPATLPDGQTPLTGLDLERVERVEVARGPIAALHGNGSQGVVSLWSPARRGRGLSLAASATGETGSHGPLRRGSASLGFGGDRLGGIVGLTTAVSPGQREHAYAGQSRYHGALEWRARDHLTVTVRSSWAVDDSIEAPGALTLAEFALDPAAASPNSLRREAGKSLSQRQLSASVSHQGNRFRGEATAWVLGRTLTNPLATPAPPPTVGTEGIWVGIDRFVTGARTTLQGTLPGGIGVTTGLDVQRMRDDRVNRRHDRGVPVGGALLDQRELVTEVGVFAQVAAALHAQWLLRGGVRHDAVHFDVADHRTPSAGGTRRMEAWSASGAVAWQSSAWELWLGAGSAFETPTTTELANRADGSTGLNRTLGPARTFSVESGMRRRLARGRLELVAFTATTDDAITAVAEMGGRSYYANRGTTSTRGIEGVAAAVLGHGLTVTGTATMLQARFGNTAVTSDGTTLAGLPLPGVPELVGRAAVAWQHQGWHASIEQAWSASVPATDAGTITVPGWGAGLTDVLVARSGLAPGLTVVLSARNLFDRHHAIGAVINAAAGRVVEPGAGRTLNLSVSIAPGS